jgi:hypothetical protein
MAEIANERCPNVAGKRHSFDSLAFAAYENFALLPVQVIQGKGKNFATPQAESSQEQ